MNIAELAVKIGFKGGKESVSTMKGLHDTTIKTKAAMLGLVVAFAKMSQEARKFAMNLDVFEANTGLSGATLQKLSYRAAEAGVALSDIAGTIQNIQSMSKQIALGEGNIKPFQMLEIDSQQDPVKILEQVGQAIRSGRYEAAMLRQIVSELGISNELYYALLNKQTDEIEEQYLLKGKDKEALVKLNREWYKLWWYVKQIGIRLQGFLAHVAIPVVKACVRIAKTVGEIVIGFGELVEKSVWLQKTLAIIALLVAATMAYLFPITAALIGIILVIEDIYGYFTGKDSITGRMIEWIKSGEILKAIFMTIGEVIRSISKLLFGSKFTKKAFDMLGTVSNFISPQIGQDGKTPNKNGFGLNLLPSMPDLFSFAKPNIGGFKGGFTINQHNELTMQSTGDAVKDAQVAGTYSKNAMISDAEMQEAQTAYGQ